MIVLSDNDLLVLSGSALILLEFGEREVRRAEGMDV